MRTEPFLRLLASHRPSLFCRSGACSRIQVRGPLGGRLAAITYACPGCPDFLRRWQAEPLDGWLRVTASQPDSLNSAVLLLGDVISNWHRLWNGYERAFQVELVLHLMGFCCPVAPRRTTGSWVEIGAPRQLLRRRTTYFERYALAAGYGPTVVYSGPIASPRDHQGPCLRAMHAAEAEDQLRALAAGKVMTW